MPSRNKSGNLAGRIAGHIILVLCAAAILLPFVWLLSQSLKNRAEMFGFPPRLIPEHLRLSNYARAIADAKYLASYANSVLVACADIVLGLLVCSLAGFGFSKYSFRFKSGLFIVVLASMMIPFHVVVIPLYLEIKSFGLLDRFAAVILPFLSKPFGVFFMRQFVREIPDELMEAARIDGATEGSIWFRLIVPLSKPAFGVLACLFFVENWNMFLWPMIVWQTKHNIQMYLQSLIGVYRIDYGVLMAGSVIAIIPVFVLFLTMQKQIIYGLTAGAIKS